MKTHRFVSVRTPCIPINRDLFDVQDSRSPHRVIILFSFFSRRVKLRFEQAASMVSLKHNDFSCLRAFDPCMSGMAAMKFDKYSLHCKDMSFSEGRNN